VSVWIILERMKSAEQAKQVDKSVLEEFNYLQRTGALEDLKLLRMENRILDSLLNDASKIYTLNSIEEIKDFVVDRVLEQFIPSYFIIMIEIPHSGIRQYCYANLKPSDETVSTHAYEALKDLAQASPYPADFGSLPLEDSIRGELELFNSNIIIPMCGIEGVYGIVILGRKVVGDPYTDVERMYIDKFARFISIAIQNNLHHQGAITDAKTGLFNHSYFQQRLAQEIARIQRHGTRAGIIMMDVDHFKIFNDTWGHLAGDEVLSALSVALQKVVRAEDVASRFGGEEFSVLAIGCDARGLLDMAERIRRAVADMAVPYKGQNLSVTVSLGCCLLDTELHLRPDEYIEMADKALYQSKKTGRNRSTLYRPGLYGRSVAVLDMKDQPE
jgi:diguanylate cyclase (GGDEF)-like protein